MTGWQWHQLDHTQIICTLSVKFFTGWMLFLMPNQQRESTEGKRNSHQTDGMILICHVNNPTKTYDYLSWLFKKFHQCFVNYLHDKSNSEIALMKLQKGLID